MSAKTLFMTLPEALDRIADLRASLAQAEERARLAYNEGVCDQLKCQPGHTPVNPYDAAPDSTPAAPLVESAVVKGEYTMVYIDAGEGSYLVRCRYPRQAEEMARVLSDARMPGKVTTSEARRRKREGGK